MDAITSATEDTAVRGCALGLVGVESHVCHLCPPCSLGLSWGMDGHRFPALFAGSPPLPRVRSPVDLSARSLTSPAGVLAESLWRAAEVHHAQADVLHPAHRHRRPRGVCEERTAIAWCVRKCSVRAGVMSASARVILCSPACLPFWLPVCLSVHVFI